jgi:membrane-associated phospholipid phosphatase
MKIIKYFIFCIIITQFAYSQDSSYTFSKFTNDLYDSFKETITWYDLPILVTNTYSNKILGNKGEFQFIKITPMTFEKDFAKTLGQNNRSSLGSMDKNIYPTLLIASRISFSFGQSLLLNEKFSKNDIKHTIVFYKSLVYTNLVTEIFKGFIRKERPDNTDSRSFFSGHSSTTFAASTFIYNELNALYESWDVTKNNPILKSSFNTLSFVGLYGWSGYVGLSRIRDNKHYLADVLIGAAVGTLISNYIYDSYFGEESDSKTNFNINQIGDATYLGFSINF